MPEHSPKGVPRNSAHGSDRVNASKLPVYERYRYKIVPGEKLGSSNGDIVRALNRLGYYGWEVTDIDRDNDGEVVEVWMKKFYDLEKKRPAASRKGRLYDDDPEVILARDPDEHELDENNY